MIISEDVIALQHTLGGKFQGLIDELNSLGSTINNIESQFGQLGMITRVEGLLERIMSKRLGWDIRFVSDIDKDYVKNISISTRVPVILLSRKFTTDLVKTLKQGNCKPVLLKLKTDLKNKANEVVNHGNDPFQEKYDYLIIEASTAGGCFHAALPVEAITLVDTDDANKAYTPEEVKKDLFVLKPTKEYLQKTLLKALKGKRLTESERQKYENIIINGVYRITKNHIQEAISKHHKILGNHRIVISRIYNK